MPKIDKHWHQKILYCEVLVLVTSIGASLVCIFEILMYCIPYGGKLWRVQTLAEWQGKHHWRNKFWRIDDKV